ncbi:MAG TPA: FGGY-family carbohydrate kinase [Abditibacteriaceae bacterium]|nr:FGGY-family carbohydrate kinase [Abditibacteriaceae bacterium]
MANTLVLGIDVGTQGARGLVADERGHVIAHATQDFARMALPDLPAGHLEQNSDDWWIAARECLSAVVAQLREVGRDPREIVAGAVDSTSGTIVLLDAQRQPIRPALMYNDRRAENEAAEINNVSHEFCDKVGYRFNSSFALPKILWLARHEPENWARAQYVVHAADYIVGKLTGVFNVSDQSNSLKTGFDLVDFQWPAFIEESLGIERARLPRVVLSGEAIGPVSQQCAAATGLTTSTHIVAGMTDGSADQIASGAHRGGDWNTVLGTTITLKGLTRQLLKDPLGRVYCHRHPLGYWMPGGASNVGARVLDERFPHVDKAAFGRAAIELSPTPLTVYPLTQKGERFPFNQPDAVGFIEGDARSDEELYAAHLEGVAFTERLAYDVVTELGAEVGERIYTTGGGAQSREWMQIRADVLGRELARASNANAAMGCAIIAASRTLFSDIAEAAARMVQIDQVVAPREDLRACYEESYQRFLSALRKRGYI